MENMDYQKVVENIMYQFNDIDEVEKYLMDIKENVSITTLQGESYLLFITFANIYIKIREMLEIHPKGIVIWLGDKKYDALVVEANLKYALQRISESIEKYINTPIVNQIN